MDATGVDRERLSLSVECCDWRATLATGNEEKSSHWMGEGGRRGLGWCQLCYTGAVVPYKLRVLPALFDSAEEGIGADEEVKGGRSRHGRK
ncbi:hypothetical protein B296_00057052 [Ensete ventricosum]|uniref:Uncharacterized protein n=1 Tax=Ensete ventricosum TaxID=4639 RepID=A0A426XSM1_ENSVE|nr:hypothetical protein B296_00057052 [Ensete ventricosum]